MARASDSPLGTPSSHDIVGVFADPTMARAVARRVVDAGVPESGVQVGGAAARVESMKGEMREEIDNSFVGPGNVGPFTKEMTRGIARFVTIGTLAGAVVALPLALIEVESLGLGARLLIAAFVGAVTGATIGFELGGGLGAKGGRDPLAAERGVTVSVSVRDDLAPTVVRIMRSAQPIRLDLGTLEGSPIATLETEEDAGARGGSTARRD